MDNFGAGRRRRRSARIAAATIAAGLAFVACGDDSGGGGDSDIVTLLEGEGETPASAECIADALADFSVDEVTAFVQGDGTNEDLSTAVATAKETCAEQVGE